MNKLSLFIFVLILFLWLPGAAPAEQVFTSANETINLAITAVPGSGTGAEGAIEEAGRFCQEGMREYAAGNWPRAKDKFDIAIKMLAGLDEGSLEPAAQQEYNNLFGSVCQYQLRVRNLIYGFSVSVDDIGTEACPFPLVFNHKVEKWLQRYVTVDYEYFGKKLYESGKYYQMIKEIFKESGLPPELAYTAFVESGFNPYAYSRANAAGMWQFVAYTGSLYGLDRDHWVDERRDVEKSTKAAAEFLRSLYKQFGSWPLALAAYNGGPNRVAKAIKDQGTNNFWDLVLPAETTEFVPKIFATIMIARDPEAYGFTREFKDAHSFDSVQIDRCVNLSTVARCCSAPLEEIVGLNPELTRMCTPDNPGTYTLKIPAGSKETFYARFLALAENQRYLSKEEVARMKGYWITYTIKAGDSLGKIAKKFNTTIEKIRQWNPSVRKQKYLQIGSKLKVFQK